MEPIDYCIVVIEEKKTMTEVKKKGVKYVLPDYVGDCKHYNAKMSEKDYMPRLRN